MKKWFTFFVVLFIAAQVNAQDSTWQVAVKSDFPPISGSYLYNQNTGWIAGSSRFLAKTIDGGATWNSIENIPSESSTFYSVQFLTKTKGFVGVSNNELLKTADDGVTWTSYTIGGPDGGAVRGIYFATENEGWALVSTSGEAAIRHTSDGCATWKTQMTNSTGDIEAMSFSSPNHGVCVGGGSGRIDLYYTKDGATWTKAPLPDGFPNVYTRMDVRAVKMYDDNIVYAAGWGSRAAGLQPSLLLKSIDGGENWTYLSLPTDQREYVNLYSIAVLDANTVIASGGASYEGTVIIKTTDGGTNWERINAKFGFALKTLSVAGDKILGAGSGGGVLISEDAGETWSMPAIIPSTSLYALTTYGNNMLIAGGYEGMLLKSTDLGLSWKALFASDGEHCPTIKDIDFVDSNVGYLARYNRMISKTTDGGETWFTVYPDTSATSSIFYGVDFVDENVGYVVGKAGTGVSAVYKTTDGGSSWTTQIGGFADHLLGVAFSDADHGVVVGRDLVVEYTNDGGITWNAGAISGSPSSSSDLDRVYFYDSQNGIAVGDIVLKTTDGGVNWDYIPLPTTTEMNTGVMYSPDHWVLSGGHEINVTYDAGQTWTNIIDWNVFDNLQLYGTALDKNNKLWVSSSSSEIYTTSSLVSVSDDFNQPQKFTLEQNYPNPFNPSTNINFVIPTTEFVTLSIYDVLGRNIATVIDNRLLQAGAHSIQLSASEYNLSSGIYFYELKSGSHFVTKKMVLMK